MKHIAFKYGLFGLIALLVNMTSQHIISLLFESVEFLQTSLPGILSKITFLSFVELGVGTGSGFVVKYILDKKWIFYAKTTSLQAEGKMFGMYMVMAIFTTIVFWGFEFGGEIVFENEYMKYLTGSIGLVIGYTMKYFLDKKYVFKTF
jgi:putative flippase GtrA